jgi:FADH2 O2-dependent halogenase
VRVVREAVVTHVAAHRASVDVAVVGSGFAGSLTAMALRRLGHSVAVIERGRHPRFAIGESSTPLANLLIEELSDTYDLPRVRPLSKWGTWQRAYPHVGCGLKRGFSFFHHTAGQPFGPDPDRERQLLVAASPHDEIADTHWYRPDFDRFLVEEACEAGVCCLDETEITSVAMAGDVTTIAGSRRGTPVHVQARFLVDASGPRGFLHRNLGLPEPPMRWLPRTQSLYAHFTDVARWEDVHAPEGVPPHPIDAAALHHVFPGGWVWVLRFANGITSAGAAVTDDLARELRLADGADAWPRLLAHVPSIGEQFANARAVTPFVYAPQLAFRSARASGDRWAMLPSAVGVIDPLLSTGFPLTLLGVSRLVPVVHRALRGEDVSTELADYEASTLRELDATERLVAALYRAMDDFPLFKRLGLLYFAAASYSETVRRLGRRERAGSFLLCDTPTFGPALRECCLAALGSPTGVARDALLERIGTAIAPIDTAGLGHATRRGWYPVLVDDLLSSVDKLGATRSEVLALAARCGLAQPAMAASPHAGAEVIGATPHGASL